MSSTAQTELVEVVARPRSSVKVGYLTFICVLLVSAWYMASNLKRGWVPHDEGALAESAERVLHGELPHRDFDEIYTGGLSFLNAAAFRIFGTNLASMRYMLYAFAMAWVVSFYCCARRLMPSAGAALLTVLAVAWSIPNYSAAVPSWYNLFFATFGLAALLRFIEHERPAFLFLAGVSGGISFLFKLSGLYFIAGVLLFLVFREQVVSQRRLTRTCRSTVYRIVVAVFLIAYLLTLLSVIRQDFTLATFIYQFVPALAISAAIAYREVTVETKGITATRLAFLFREVGIFAAGASLPVGLFLIPYLRAAGLRSFVYGVFVLPARRFAFASMPPKLVLVLVGLAFDCLLLISVFLIPSKFRKYAWLAAVAIPPLVILARMSPYLYKAEWATIWMLLPFSVVAGVVLLPRSPTPWVDERRQQAVFLIISVAAACSLVQFPYTVAIYFVYIAPLMFLAAPAVMSLTGAKANFAMTVAGIFCLALVILDVTPGFLYEMGSRYSRNKQTAVLKSARAANLRVLPESATQYSVLTGVIAEHAHGEYIYATPDCPEVYFLSGHRNPTRTLFEFLGAPVTSGQAVLSTLRDGNVNLVVINRKPWFSDPIPDSVRAALNDEFPNAQSTLSFEVRWK